MFLVLGKLAGASITTAKMYLGKSWSQKNSLLSLKGSLIMPLITSTNALVCLYLVTQAQKAHAKHKVLKKTIFNFSYLSQAVAFKFRCVVSRKLTKPL